MQPKVGGKLHPRLNTCTSPIVNKYREGKLKSTLKRDVCLTAGACLWWVCVVRLSCAARIGGCMSLLVSALSQGVHHDRHCCLSALVKLIRSD
ncbi:hypothetical protein T4E_3017 [Trichinella pseudospiralis]|uniref:Uncharacterized protein n=1 Tax=Trichinella pseudospiralis TaxID=6337 RepID=A0A0V0XCV3_TRIPS|nr:hypothetical protein T4E_3017 [Trichinella pseudospiralis]